MYNYKIVSQYPLGLAVEGFHLLVRLRVFNTEQMSLPMRVVIEAGVDDLVSAGTLTERDGRLALTPLTATFHGD